MEEMKEVIAYRLYKIDLIKLKEDIENQLDEKCLSKKDKLSILRGIILKYECEI